MNKISPSAALDAVESTIEVKRRFRVRKIILSFFLGIVGVFLLFFLGETWGERVMFFGVAAYFLLTQYFLSHGNSQALRKDWSIIIALNLPIFFSTIMCVAGEPNWAAKKSALWLMAIAVACSYFGAAAAARTTRS